MNLSQIIETFELELLTPLPNNLQIQGVRALDQAGPGDLSFLTSSKPKYREMVRQTKASAVLVRELQPQCEAVQLGCANPDYVRAKVLELLFPEPKPAPGVHPSAVIGKKVVLGDGCTIGPFCVVDDGATIGAGTILDNGVSVAAGCEVGADCRLFPHVVLYQGTRLGDRVRIHANSVVGSDGFGYTFHQGQQAKIPQVGGVLVGDDVEIGSNVSIDRGGLEDTVIGQGVKIDNLVQIAHGVRIGDHGMIVSQSGISGSTTLGKYNILAGQVGVVGHIELGDGVIVMGDAVVTKSLPKSGQYAGNPAVPHMRYQRQQASIRRLDSALKRIKELEKRIQGDTP